MVETMVVSTAVRLVDHLALNLAESLAVKTVADLAARMVAWSERQKADYLVERLVGKMVASSVVLLADSKVE